MSKPQMFYKIKQKDRKTGELKNIVLKHGDRIRAKIGNPDADDEDLMVEVVGRICINSSRYENSSKGSLWICQNEKDGCQNADEKFEYQYGWVCHIEDGMIESYDTAWIEHLLKNPDVEATQEKKAVIEDYMLDDPMPENWEPSEQDKAFFS